MDLTTISQQVGTNHLILQTIAPHITHPADRVRARLVSTMFDKAMMDYQHKNKTLKFTKTIEDDGIDITFRDIHFLFENEEILDEERLGLFPMFSQNTSEYLEEIMDYIPEDSLHLVKTIIAKGYEDNEIKIDEHFGQFLNHFPNLKHLELDYVSLEGSFFEKYSEYSFIKNIENLHLMNLQFSGDDKLKSLVIGENLKNLYMTEKMLRKEKDLLDWFDNTSVFVAIFLDKKDWETGRRMPPLSRPFYTVQEDNSVIFHEFFQTLDIDWYINQIKKCHLVNFFQISTREINLDNETIPRIKHCENLIELKLHKLKEGGNDVEIGRTISEIQHLKKLEKLTIDGCFESTHLRQLTASMEDCPKLSKLSVRMRSDTANTTDWIGYFRTIPQRISHIELDNIVSDEAIIALNDRKSDSLKTLHWIIRENEPSSEAVRMVTEDLGMFTGLSDIIMEDGKGIKEMRRGYDFRIEENGGSRKRQLPWEEIVGEVDDIWIRHSGPQ